MNVAVGQLAALVPEEGMGVESTSLLLFRAIPGVDANAQRGLPVAREELKLLRVVPALEAQGRGCSISLDRRSVVTGWTPRQEVLGHLRGSGGGAWTAARMREKLGAAIILRHSDHACWKAKLVVC